MRALAQFSAAQPGPYGLGEDARLDATDFARRVTEYAGAALRAGVDPASAEAAKVVSDILEHGPGARRWARRLRELEDVFTDPPGRYWQLVALINGWPPFPSHVPDLDQITEALRAHAWVIAALHAQD